MALAQTDPVEDTKPWKSFSDEPDNPAAAGFDCNICLDTVHDPVVTLCGHLFCWPCIYKWLQFSPSPEPHHPQQCPVCKAEVSEASLVPLYGRGRAAKPGSGPRQGPSLGIVVPKRPQFCGADSPRASPAPQLYGRGPGRPGSAGMNLLEPGIGIYGEMVYARVFGNSITNLYTYPNSYHLAGNASPRIRRHVMQADESLSRICFFLLCCVLLCLLLF